MEVLVDFFKENRAKILASSVLLTSGLIIWSKKFKSNPKINIKTRLDGQTAIVTGSNAGIGYEVALDLAKRGARVILACRDLINGKKAMLDIRKKANNNNVFVERIDLASLDSVSEFAMRVLNREDKINILVNNAGLFSIYIDMALFSLKNTRETFFKKKRLKKSKIKLPCVIYKPKL